MPSKPVSVAPPEIGGVSVISGLWGTGKTTLALTCENPALTTMIDFDLKSAAKARALGLEYFSPAAIGMDDPLDYDLDKLISWFRATIRDLPRDGKTTMIIDNGSPVEAAFGKLVGDSPASFGVNPANAASGSFGGVNPGVGQLWESTISYLERLGYERVFIIMHMSQSWTRSGPIPNKYKAKGNKTLSQLSNLSLILSKAKEINAPPNAIVAKEALGVIRYDDGEFNVLQALPPRIPHCDWDKIKEYIASAGTRTSFEDDEIPSAFEMSCYGEFMTPEQVAFIKAVAENPEFTMTDQDPPADAAPAPPTPAGDKSACPICKASASASSDKGHAPWCKARDNGSRYDSRR